MNDIEKRLVRCILRHVKSWGDNMYDCRESQVTELLEILLGGDEE